MSDILQVRDKRANDSFFIDNHFLRGIGADLSSEYLDRQARSRLALDAWAAWHGGRDGKGGEPLAGLPLFEGLAE